MINSNSNKNKIQLIVKILLSIVFYLIYGGIAMFTYVKYSYYIGLSGMELEKVKNVIDYFKFIIVFYSMFFISLYNTLSITSFIIISSRLYKKETFSKFLKRSIGILLLSYVISLFIFLVINLDGKHEIFKAHLPHLFGSKNSEIFIGNIILGSLLFYTWFIPLRYYLLKKFK